MSSAPLIPRWRWYHWLAGHRIRAWTLTGTAWLGGAAVALVFLTDWQVVIGRIPYVRGKFPPPVIMDESDEGTENTED